MTKEEMKDKISMALKDPILQQGFEIICKNLDELEKENEKLKKRLSVLLSCKKCPDNKGGFICQKEYEDKCLTQKIQYIKELKEENTELEKENAELNKKLSKAEEEYDKMFWNKNEIISKAKETIRMVVDSYHNKERFSFEKDLIKAEQFLKEVS
jgi:hypothetical protein